MHQLAKATGWGFREIMEDVPVAVGLQIIDAECLSNQIMRYRITESKDGFDLRSHVEATFARIRNERNNTGQG